MQGVSPSDRRAQMLSILADAVEVGRRLSASPPPRLHERMGTQAQRRRLLVVTGGVVGALVAATGAVHAMGGPDQPVRAPYTPPTTTAASAADTGVYPDPAGLSGVQLPRIAVATRPPLPPPPALPARIVPAGLGPSRARSPVHRVVAPPAAAPLPPPPPQLVAGPMLPQPPTASPVPPPIPPSPPSTPAPSPSASPR
jgi:hypothetical protein